MKSVGVLVVLLASGCGIDDRMLTTVPDPILIDNFEDVTGQPMDPRFNHWEFTTFNADPEMSDANLVQPGFESDWCMRVDWDVTDVPDGVPNYPGFLAHTLAIASIDLTGYTHLNFAHFYQHQGACQPLQFIDVDFGCGELNGGFEMRVPVSPTWTTTSVSLADLREATFPPPTGLARADCLRVFDGLQFVTQADLPDGACSSGSLFIDDVSITAD